MTVASVEQTEITEWEEFTGRTEAVEAVEVRPRVLVEDKRSVEGNKQFVRTLVARTGEFFDYRRRIFRFSKRSGRFETVAYAPRCRRISMPFWLRSSCDLRRKR